MHAIEKPLRIDATSPTIQPLPCLVPYPAADNRGRACRGGNGEGVGGLLLVLGGSTWALIWTL